MADRRGPTSGYDFGNKRQYRRNVWATFKRNRCWPMRECVAILMPSVEGIEIEHAEAAGLQRDNLHAFDRSAAIAATVSRNYPGIHAHGIDVARSGERLPRWSVAFANLDLCGKVSVSTAETLSAFGGAGVIRDGGIVSVSLSRGRESFWDVIRARVGDMLRAANIPQPEDGDKARAFIAAVACCGLRDVTDPTTGLYLPSMVRRWSYRSAGAGGRTTMLVTMFRLWINRVECLRRGLVAPGPQACTARAFEDVLSGRTDPGRRRVAR